MTTATYKYTDQGLRLRSVVSGGDLCVSNRAARVGRYGLQITILGGTNTYAYQQVSFTAASEFRSRFYVNPNTMKMSSGDSFIIYQAYNGSGTAIARISLEYDGSDYNIKSEVSNDAASWSTTQDDAITDAWHYVEIHVERASSAVSANGRMRTWIDGTLEGTTSSLDLYDLFPISTVRWGAITGVESGTEGTFYVDGIVLTDGSAEIGAAATDLWRSDADLVSLWRFEEGADGVTRVDSVGDNDLTDHNTVASSSDSLEGDYAADFESSSSQHLTIADGSQSGLDVTGEFTICCRIKMESLAGSMVIFNRYKTSTNDRSYQLRVGSDGYVRFYLSSTGTDYTIVKGGTLVSAGNEYSIVATYDGEYGYVYLDGELDTQTGTDPNPGLHGDMLYDASADVYVGLNEGGSLYWDGLIDELAFVNRSFTPDEALGYHENGFQQLYYPPPTPVTGLATDDDPAVEFLVFDLSGKLIDDLVPDLQSVAWRLEERGQTRFSLPYTDPKCKRGTLQYGNLVLVRFSNYWGLPDWVGAIDPPGGQDDFVVSRTAWEAPQLLSWHVTLKGRVFSSTDPGEIVRTLSTDAIVAGLPAVEIGRIETGSAAWSEEYHHQPLLAQVYDLAKRTGCNLALRPVYESGKALELYLDWYTPRRGRDLRNKVLLEHGANISAASLSEQGPIVNRPYVVGSGSTWNTQRKVGTYDHAESQARYGLREGTAQRNTDNQSVLDAEAKQIAADSAYPVKMLSLTVLNEPPALFQSYDLGDIVHVVCFPDGGDEWALDGAFRIIGREWMPEGVCRLIVREWND